MDEPTVKALITELNAVGKKYGIGPDQPESEGQHITMFVFIILPDGTRAYAGYGCAACAIEDGMKAVVMGQIQHASADEAREPAARKSSAELMDEILGRDKVEIKH